MKREIKKTHSFTDLLFTFEEHNFNESSFYVRVEFNYDRPITGVESFSITSQKKWNGFNGTGRFVSRKRDNCLADKIEAEWLETAK